MCYSFVENIDGEPRLFSWTAPFEFTVLSDEEIQFSAIKAKETADAYEELSYLQYEFMEKHNASKLVGSPFFAPSRSTM